jgi:hypothetical protein
MPTFNLQDLQDFTSEASRRIITKHELRGFNPEICVVLYDFYEKKRLLWLSQHPDIHIPSSYQSAMKALLNFYQILYL